MTLPHYDLLEDNIVDRLSPLVDIGIDVIPMPNTKADFRSAFEKPRIIVAYSRSEYDDQIIKGKPQTFSTSHSQQNGIRGNNLTYYGSESSRISWRT